MPTLIYLIFVHFIADWGLQNRWMAETKYDELSVMIAHCLVWTGCICIAMHHLGVVQAWHMFFLFGGHIIIDLLKGVMTVGGRKNVIKWLWVDQFAHMLQIVVVCL